ncbi:PKD domain-containing protein [bacterium]|nr:PKD domain-containing protein [bacterium]
MSSGLGGNRERKSFYCFLSFLFFLMNTTLFSVQVHQMQIVDKVVLANDGFSAELDLHPTDGSLHVAWVDRFGDIKYSVRNFSGGWSTPMTVPDGGVNVYGLEEGLNERKCLGISIDYRGITHMVFADSGGDIYYLYGVPGQWSTPVKIVNKDPYSIHLDILAVKNNLYVVYEDADKDKVYGVYRIGGSWIGPVLIATGEYCSLTKGSNDRIYFLNRGGLYEANDYHRIKFAVVDNGQTAWQFKSGMTDPHVGDVRERGIGQGPNLAVFGNKIYMAWSLGLDDPDPEKKNQCFVSFANEPGNTWTPRIGEMNPTPYDTPYYENTGDPHNRVSVYSDNTVIHMNGSRNERFRIFDGGNWSAFRDLPIQDGNNYSSKLILQVVNDGRTAWAVSSLANSAIGQISVFGITDPYAEVLNPPAPDAVDVLTIVAKKVLDGGGYSGDVAVHPVEGTVHAVWVQGGGLKYSMRGSNGAWGTVQDVPTGGQIVQGELFGWPRPCVSLDIDYNGSSHIAFGTSTGDLYYVKGTPGSWTAPVRIAEHSGFVVYPDLAAWQNTVTVVYENSPDLNVYSVQARNGAWQQPALLGAGENPVLSRGKEGRLYLCYRSLEFHRDMHFAWRIPTFTDWQMQTSVVVPEDAAGASPGMAVWDNYIYIAWNNDTGEEFTDYKSQLFCTVGTEPGLNWHPSPGIYGPIYYENTGDPHPRISSYSDGQILYLNGRRLDSRFALYNGDIWSKVRSAPWTEGYPNVTTDGHTVWVMVTSNSSAAAEVSVTGIQNPDADPYNFSDPGPMVTFDVDTLTAEVGHDYVFEIGSVDAGGHQITGARSSVTPLLDGMNFNTSTNTFTWTPTQAQLTANPWGEGSGKYLFGIVLTNEYQKSETVYFWIQVINANQPPEITSSPVTSVNLGETYSYAVTAQDPEGSALTFSLLQAPSGMSIGTSGQITWTPVPADEGSHQVTVRVTDGPGEFDEQVFTVQVIDNTIPPPVAQFTADILEGVLPLTVRFTDQSTGEIVSHAWTFGDLESSDAADPVHVYDNAGTFTVRLIVGGPGGADTLTVTDMIHVLQPPPEAGFTADPLNGGLPLTVQFTDTSKGAVLTYLWDFGDGSGSTLRHPQHTYETAGQFSVKLKVTGPGGMDSVLVEDMIQAMVSGPVAAFSAEPAFGTLPLTVQFTSHSTGDISSYAWTFGDGETGSDEHPEHIYQTEGEYTVRLIVTGSGGADTLTVTQMIRVTATRPIAIFTADITSGPVPLAVQFTDQSYGDVSSYAWDFGDGETSSEQHPAHTYSAEGQYNVQLIVSGASGSDTLHIPQMIHVNPLSGITDADGIPASFQLYPNVPNPFNPVTQITYDLPEQGHVRIVVYDLRGQQIRTLKDSAQPAGQFRLVWDGTNEEGCRVASGVYMIVMHTDTDHAYQKAILIK